VRIHRLSLYQYKNHEQADLQFSTSFSCLTGPNGAGKTNLLDAIYYCSFCRSARHSVEDQNLMHGRDGFRIQGHFAHQGQELQVEVRYRRGAAKEFFCSGERYTRLADHIGRLPLVLTGPEDLALVEGYAEERRRFLDTALSTLHRDYLEALMRYNRALAQRNAALRRCREGQAPDLLLLDSYSQPMQEAGALMHRYRARFLEALQPLFADCYRLISGQAETPGLQWNAGFPPDGDLVALHRRNLQRDMALGRTGAGPHRDDLVLLLNEHPAKLLGSQGQKKTLLYALRLAQWLWLGSALGSPPLLLLDDVFDKLDRGRVEALFSLLASQPDAQVLITDTNLNRVEEVFGGIGVACQALRVEPGRILPA
jgi:DNA replication and repair protein RecF